MGFFFRSIWTKLQVHKSYKLGAKDWVECVQSALECLQCLKSVAESGGDPVSGWDETKGLGQAERPDSSNTFSLFPGLERVSTTFTPWCPLQGILCFVYECIPRPHTQQSQKRFGLPRCENVAAHRFTTIQPLLCRSLQLLSCPTLSQQSNQKKTHHCCGQDPPPPPQPRLHNMFSG